MSNSGDLLRMLMPAVSPVPTHNAPRPQAQPIESRSFDSLLAEARLTEPAVQAESTENPEANEGTERTNTQNKLPGLTGIGSIHNASLRMMMSDSEQK